MLNGPSATKSRAASPSPGDLDAIDLSDSQSMRGGVITVFGKGLGFALRLGSIVVLARLLTPEDYGLFAVPFAIVYLVNLIRDFGLETATVQRTQLTQAQVGNLFYINLSNGILLLLATVAAAPLIGWVYREPRLVGVLHALSFMYVLDALASQPQALLKRAFKFGTLALIDVVATFGGVVAAIAAAQFHAGYWSLVLMYLATSAVRTAGVWRASAWRPSRPDRGVDVRPMLAMGGQLTAFVLLNHSVRNVDNLLIGWYWGARELGLYDKAYQLLLLPHLQITLPLAGIALSTLSRLQADWNEYRRNYARIATLTASLGMPLIAFLFVAADPAINVILGPQWQASVAIFRALAPAAFADTVLVSFTWVLVSLGQTQRLFRTTLAITALSIAGFVIGLPWGAVGVATAFSLTRMLVALPLWVYACRLSPLQWADVARTLAKPALAALGAAAGVAVLSPILSPRAGALLDLIRDAVVFGGLYLAIWATLPGGRAAMGEAIRWIPALRERWARQS